MDPDEQPSEPPSPQLPPDPFAIGKARAVDLHEAHLLLCSSGFTWAESLYYLAACGTLNSMFAIQEALRAITRDMPEQPEQD